MTSQHDTAAIVAEYRWQRVHPPGHGPWAGEPDKLHWIDPCTDLDCLVVRTPRTGALCGYVGVPPGHPWHTEPAHLVDQVAQVHGGVSYAGLCEAGGEHRPAVSHVAVPGRAADVWWLGFHCAHPGDYQPATDIGHQTLTEEQYRSLVYVQEQVAQLATQAHMARELAAPPAPGVHRWRMRPPTTPVTDPDDPRCPQLHQGKARCVLNVGHPWSVWHHHLGMEWRDRGDLLI
jgi:hypothetical protein